MAKFLIQGSKCTIWGKSDGYWARALLSCERDEVNNEFTISVLGMQNYSYAGGSYGVNYTCKLSCGVDSVEKTVKVITTLDGSGYYPKSGTKYNSTYFKAVKDCSLKVKGTDEGKCPDINLYFKGSQTVHFESKNKDITIKSSYNSSITDACRQAAGDNDVTPPEFVVCKVLPYNLSHANCVVNVNTGAEENTFDLSIYNPSNGALQLEEKITGNSAVGKSISVNEGYNNISITATKNNNNKKISENVIVDCNRPIITKFNTKPISNTQAEAELVCQYPHKFSHAIINGSQYTYQSPYKNSHKFVFNPSLDIVQDVVARIIRHDCAIDSLESTCSLDMRKPTISSSENTKPNLTIPAGSETGTIAFIAALTNSGGESHIGCAQWIDGNGTILDTKTDVPLDGSLTEWTVHLKSQGNYTRSYVLRVARSIDENNNSVLYTDYTLENSEACSAEIQDVEVNDNTIKVTVKVNGEVHYGDENYHISAWLINDDYGFNPLEEGKNGIQGILESEIDNTFSFEFTGLPLNIPFLFNIVMQHAASTVTSTQIITDSRLKCLSYIYVYIDNDWQKGTVYVHDGTTYKAQGLYVNTSNDVEPIWKYGRILGGENN